MSQRHRSILLNGVAWAIGAMVFANQSAVAQTADANAPTEIETVTVTANLRQENMQKVPIEIFSLSASEADQRGIHTLDDLQQVVPGLVYNRNNSSGLLFIRGLGPPTGAVGFEGPVSVYLDDVYQPSPVGNMASLFGMQRVEVDNGPQGTLFGRNSLGGAVRVITEDPGAQPEAHAQIGYANYDTFSGNFYGSNPISNTLAANVAVSAYDQGRGWGTNLATGLDVHKSQEFSVRPKVVWSPDDKTQITVWAFYDTLTDDEGAAQNFVPGSIGKNGVTTTARNFYDVNEDLQTWYTNRHFVGSVQAQRDFGWATLKSITAYTTATTTGQKDSDSEPTPVGYSYQQPADQYDDTFTQELRLTSEGDDRLKWVGGVFYFNDISGYDPVLVGGPNNTAGCSPPAAPTACTYYKILTTQLTTSYSAYAQSTYEILEGLNLTGGLRYTDDWRHVHGGQYGSNGFAFATGNQERSWAEWTYKGAIDYAITNDVLAYVSYSTGFNSGSFNTGGPNQPSVNPATIKATEGGLKTEFFDHRLRLNTDGFFYDYDNMVLKQLQPTASTILYNAAKSQLYGLDEQFVAEVTNQWSFEGATEWLRTDFLSFTNAPATVLNPHGGTTTKYVNYTGQELFMAPTFTANLGTQYRIPISTGEIMLGATYQYNSGYDWFATADASGNITHRATEGAYSVLNLSVDWTFGDGKWDVRLWGENVTGTEYYGHVESGSYGDTYSPAPPATVGVTVDVKY